jgi:hypothetical protein
MYFLPSLISNALNFLLQLLPICILSNYFRFNLQIYRSAKIFIEMTNSQANERIQWCYILKNRGSISRTLAFTICQLIISYLCIYTWLINVTSKWIFYEELEFFFVPSPKTSGPALLIHAGFCTWNNNNNNTKNIWLESLSTTVFSLTHWIMFLSRLTSRD